MRILTLIIALFLIAADLSHAQRPGQPPNSGGARRGGRGRGPGGPAGFHMMTALDADKDGKISPKEIANAVVALTKLDKNKDGKLSAEEIGWPPAGGFFRFFGGGRGRGGPPGRGGRGPGRGGFPGFGGFFGGQQEDEDASPKRRPDPDRDRDALTIAKSTFFSRRQILALDRDKDGKIVRSEVPKGLRKLIFGRLDTNKNKVIDKEELRVLK